MTDKFIQEVADRLAEYLPADYGVSVEYPGYIHVARWPEFCEPFWNFGTANGNWGGDLCDFFTGEVIECFETGVPRTCDSARAIASNIHLLIRWWKSQQAPSETELDEARL